MKKRRMSWQVELASELLHGFYFSFCGLSSLIRFCIFLILCAQYTVAARSKARTVFTRSNVVIMDSNPTQAMDAYVCVYSVSAVLCVLGSGLATG
jgi:hypothetical protein